MLPIDLSFLNARNNRILLANAHPSILVTNLPTVTLNVEVEGYPITPCSIWLFYNKYRGRNSMNGAITMAHVIAAMARTSDDRDALRLIIAENKDISDLIPSQAIIASLIGTNIVIHGTRIQAVHEYARDRIVGGTVEGIYAGLRSSLSVNNRPLTRRAILGGIAYGLGDAFTEAQLHEQLGKMTHTTAQRLTANEFHDSFIWYRAQVDARPVNPSFYRTALELIQAVPTMDISTYDPQLDSEDLIIVPVRPLDPIDTVSSTRTSRDIPALIADMGERKLIKTYDRVEKQIPWFHQVKPQSMRLITRVTQFPDRYQDVEYNAMRNQVYISTRSRFIPVPDVMNSICSAVNLKTLTVPTVSRRVYTFISNFISDGTGAVGIDRNIMSRLITNPPPPYRDTNLGDYIFMREDTDPTSLKEHVSIHIQLGVDKMYISLSKQVSTTGTIIDQDGELTSIIPGQEFLMVRINSCPSIHHARICQYLYRQLITMYMENYAQARQEILALGIDMPDRPPVMNTLFSVPTTPHYRLVHADPVLYKYTSTIRNDRLPIPIKRNEIEEWRRRGYGVIMVPAIVTNNTRVEFESSSRIWLRTPTPGTEWSLHRKNNDLYIPLPRNDEYKGDIHVTVNPDWTLTEEYGDGDNIRYVLEATSNLMGRMLRYAGTTNTTSSFLRPLVGDGIVLRYGITDNPLFNLNTITGKELQTADIAMHAYLALQSCWDQSIPEIQDDINVGRIDIMRHHRALERAFELNIYMMMEDPVEPYLLKPRHAHFYLHKNANPDWPTVVMHTMSGADGYLTIIAILDGEGNHTYTFPTTDYMDKKMRKNNIISMVSPENKTHEQVKATPLVDSIYGWIAAEQVIDAYGKTRAINYRNRRAWVTLGIGFSPILELPIGDIRRPSQRFAQEVSTREGLYRDSWRLIIRPDDGDGGFNRWKQMEKDARTLRVVAHLLYSSSGQHIDDFMEHMVIDPDVQYDLANLTNTLPVLEGDRIWEYFQDIIPTMVYDKEIIIPDEQTRDALYDHMRATPKSEWPKTLPGFLRYTWDIRSHKNESIFMSDRDLLQSLILERSPTVVPSMRISTIAYLLNMDGRIFMVQMAKDMAHASYIIWSWNEMVINPGYNIENMEPKDIDFPRYNQESLRTAREPGVYEWSDSPFVMIPLV